MIAEPAPDVRAATITLVKAEAFARYMQRKPRGGYSLTPRCRCCGAVYATWRDWRALEWVGTQPTYAERGPQSLELRLCGCGTTLAREIEA